MAYGPVGVLAEMRVSARGSLELVYTPRPFRITDDAARELLAGVDVAQLVTATPAGPMATLMPWVPDVSEGLLIGHMARPNPQWQTPWLGQAMVLVGGPHGYVSPSWYASKAEHGRVVPTWDYVVLQVYGDLVIHEEPEWTRDAVRLLTDRHESPRQTPWSVSDAPTDYLAGQLGGIVGLEVRIERIEASVKMSQNKSAADVAGVIAGFMADGNVETAEWVRRASS